MPRLASLVLALLVASSTIDAQSVTVETLVPAGSEIADALALGPDGALYGSRFGSFDPFVPGETVSRIALEDGTGTIYASGFSFPNGLAFGPDGSLFVVSYYDAAINAGRVSRVAPDGTVSVIADLPDGTTVSGAIYDAVDDELYITSYDNDWVKTLGLDGTFTDVIEGGDLDGPAGLAFDDQNRLHVANFNDGKIFRIEDGALVLVADVQQAIGFLAYGGGRFFATGINDHRIYAVTESGAVTAIAGQGKPGSADGDASLATFNAPNGIVATAAGDTLYVSDAGTRAIRRITIATSTSSQDAPSSRSSLLPVSPNPAVGNATARFVLEDAGEVEVAVFDTLGRRVRDLASGVWAVGTHAVALEAEGLPAGTYVVVLRAGGSVESQTWVRQ
ncbi:T9SS type A sorting domain-containing protein [Rubrivirga sp.]|uniref:T9SS type A sorting domain-containing protein n=1 Tax=Rubrivirga sp. TaxID=1885344 RepID=UPI003C72BA78